MTPPNTSPTPTTPIIIHIAQFEHGGIPDQPALFETEDAMNQWISDELNAPNALFPRLPDEPPADHVAALIEAQDNNYDYTFDEEQARAANRNGQWNWQDDTLRLWEATFTFKPHATQPPPVNPAIL